MNFEFIMSYLLTIYHNLEMLNKILKWNYRPKEINVFIEYIIFWGE